MDSVRHVARRTSLLAGFMLFGCASASVINAELQQPSDQLPQEPPTYVSGEMIVKFTPDVRPAIEQARSQGRFPTVEIPSLNTLFQQYGVSAIEPVFAGTQSPEEIRAKFPERAKRAPEGVEIPDLSTTYLLTMDPHADVLAAVAAFAADPNVEYAEPNRILTIQSSEEGVQ